MIPLENTAGPNSRAAVATLAKMQPGGPWHLVAIKPDSRPVARTFAADDTDLMVAWIERRQKKDNIYFHVNPLKPGRFDIKAKKDDVAHVAMLHVDIDSLDDRRFEAFDPKPTFVVFSGGGIQAFWRLKEPCFDLSRAEGVNRTLASLLGGDNCQSADHLMRLAFTWNVPNKTKRARGRVPIGATILEEHTDWSRAYSIDQFPQTSVSEGGGDPTLVDAAALVPVAIESLPASLTDTLTTLIHRGDDPEHQIGSANSRFPSRSEVVFRVAIALAKAGSDVSTIAGVLLNPSYGISGSVLEKRSPQAYALRQAARAIQVAGTHWPDRFKDGSPRPTFANTILAIQRMEIICKNDDFHKRKITAGRVLHTYQGDVSDDACGVLRRLILEQFGFDPGKEHTRDAVNSLCLENTYHPVRDYLASLQWDGTPRLGSWLRDYLSAGDTQLNSAIGTIMLVAAVRRIRQPGTKFDNIVVLEGGQGSGKSTAVKILAGDDNFSDQDILSQDGKSQMELVEGVWLYEICELQGISRADTEKVKAFASRSTDRARPAYGRFRENRPRQVIFIGTTNDDRYLRDQTGNRRFWPVRTGSIDLERLARDRDQLWAEAALMEAEGQSIVLPEGLWPAARDEQELRMEDDPWLDRLSTVTGDQFGDFMRVSSAGLLTETLSMAPDRQQQHHTKRLAHLMRRLGWEGPKNVKVERGRVVRGYERSFEASPDHRPDVNF